MADATISHPKCLQSNQQTASPPTPPAHLHISVVCRQLHGGRHNLAPKVLVNQARAGQLGVEAVAKHLAKAALVVVEAKRLCRRVVWSSSERLERWALE